jgi:hypothetical protein
MVKGFSVIACGLLAAAAWGADVAVDGGLDAGAPSLAAPSYDQSTLELQWDNGSRRWSVAWYTGAGSWVGNDFDASTLKTTHVKVLKFKFYTRNDWPNQVWDGFRVGFYNFGGGVPGSMLWPTGGGGYFFKPSGAGGHVWVECDINWTCPTNKFVACEEQFYNWPNCDPWGVDNNPTFLRHSWVYYGGTWSPLTAANVQGIEPYYNLMVRLWVETGQTFPGVAPSSVGRVKALYY